MARSESYKVLSLILGVMVIVLVINDLSEPGLKRDRIYSARRAAQGPNTIVEINSKEQRTVDDLIKMDKNVPLIWIGGVPRSGTTLSRAILDAHPDIRCGEETRVIPKIMLLHQKMTASPVEKARLDEAKVTDDVLEFALGTYILSVIAKHGELAPRLCNKDPFTLKAIDLILKMFPQSKFILMVRDGRAVAHSIISRKITIAGFDTESYSGALKDWNRIFKIMYNECLKYSHVCMPLVYEQLVIDPEPELRKVFKFLGIPWNDIVLHHEETIGKEGGISLSKRERSTDQVNRPVNMEALYKWVDHMPKVVKDQASSLAPMLEVLGYNPDNPIVNYGAKSKEQISKEADEMKASEKLEDTKKLKDEDKIKDNS